MKIAIAGGTGFLGRPLAAALAGLGHTLVLLSRGASAPVRTPLAANMRTATWTPDGSVGVWAAEVDGADAVVNLAGEPIDKRWTRTQKARILDSRVRATQSLVSAIARAAAPPAVFVSGSAVGIYGPRGDQRVDEDTPTGNDFLASVASRWEAEAQRAAGPRTRVVTIRTGLVLERDGGALPKMLPPFWFGMGGPIGSGRQYWPWIHRRDWIGLVRAAIDTPTLSGPLNAVAPHPVSNAEFARALGRAMHRPARLPAPAVILKLLLGDMADGLLLSGQRAVPAKAERCGFRFEFPRLDAALADLFQ
jgi:uncharacterized protein (TIGR01777 family)